MYLDLDIENYTTVPEENNLYIGIISKKLGLSG